MVDPDINKRIGRIYPEMIRGEPRWMWFLQTEPAPPPNSGTADSLEDAKVAFERRYAEVKAGSDRRRAVAAVSRRYDACCGPQLCCGN